MRTRLVSLALLFVPATLHADPTEHSTEVAVAAYTRRVEDMNSGGASDIDRTGDALEAKIGFRPIQWLTLGMYTELGGFDHDSTMPAMAQLAIGAFADLHLMPQDGIDPWIELGAGTGYERIRAQFGLDSHTSARFAAAPVVGIAYTNNTAEHEWVASIGVLVPIRP